MAGERAMEALQRRYANRIVYAARFALMTPFALLDMLPRQDTQQSYIETLAAWVQGVRDGGYVPYLDPLQIRATFGTVRVHDGLNQRMIIEQNTAQRLRNLQFSLEGNLRELIMSSDFKFYGFFNRLFPTRGLVGGTLNSVFLLVESFSINFLHLADGVIRSVVRLPLFSLPVALMPSSLTRFVRSVTVSNRFVIPFDYRSLSSLIYIRFAAILRYNSQYSTIRFPAFPRIRALRDPRPPQPIVSYPRGQTTSLFSTYILDPILIPLFNNVPSLGSRLLEAAWLKTGGYIRKAQLELLDLVTRYPLTGGFTLTFYDIYNGPVGVLVRRFFMTQTLKDDLKVTGRMLASPFVLTLRVVRDQFLRTLQQGNHMQRLLFNG